MSVVVFILWLAVAQASNLHVRSMFPAHVFTPNGGPISPNMGLSIPSEQKHIMKDLSWTLRLLLLKDYIIEKNEKEARLKENGHRRVDVQALVLPAARRDDDVGLVDEAENDDNNMKMKLFRLMYETVRDSDLKVKRAELIKRAYANSSAFEIGYLLGDITDKYNIMNDIATTLKRLYHEWKPIEHINAYEQIANLGIDVGHIIDMIKGVEKRMRNVEMSSQDKVTPPPELDYFEIPGGF